MARKKLKKAEPTYYELLGLTRKFTAEQLRANWRALSRELHPDRTGDTSLDGSSAFASLSQAYATLSDPALRRFYDAKLDLISKPCEACNGAGETYKQKGFAGRVATLCGACNGTGRAPKV